MFLTFYNFRKKKKKSACDNAWLETAILLSFSINYVFVCYFILNVSKLDYAKKKKKKIARMFKNFH